MNKPASRQELKRQATEQKIIDAFETVLHRDGIQQIGVNAIIKEAGVGKGLIYDYFGGLSGLIDAWVARSQLIPDIADIAGQDLQQFLQQSIARQIGEVSVNYASYLRNTPLALEVFAEELQKESSISKSMARLREQIGTSHEKFFTEITAVKDPDDIALIFILQAAANYLALRSRSSPVFNGVDLDTEQGWQTVMQMMQRLAARFDNEQP